jgi:hypothetical protein
MAQSEFYRQVRPLLQFPPPKSPGIQCCLRAKQELPRAGEGFPRGWGWGLGGGGCLLPQLDLTPTPEGGGSPSFPWLGPLPPLQLLGTSSALGLRRWGFYQGKPSCHWRVGGIQAHTQS